MAEPKFHNYFRWAPLNDAEVLRVLSFSISSGWPWAAIDDMDCEPEGSLRAHVEDMIRRGVAVEVQGEVRPAIAKQL